MFFRRTAPLLLAILIIVPAAGAQDDRLWVGPNVNMVSGTTFPDGDPFLQRQNEPSGAPSTRNPLHLLAGANDYRAVDIPGLPEGKETGDSWLGVFKSLDGGSTWKSYLLPGYPQDDTPEGLASPLKGFDAGADPVVRAGTDGLFYYAGIVFIRENLAESAIFVARFEDLNNDERGDPIVHHDTRLVATASGTLFVDKPWMAVDKPRGGQCGNVYVAWAEIDSAGLDPTSRIMFSRSTDCGATWSAGFPLSASGTLPQGATIAVAPTSGDVYVAWRQHTTLTLIPTDCFNEGGHWMNHPEDWPVESITMGNVFYTKAEAINILKTSRGGDATYILAKQLIPAKLNFEVNNVSAEIQAVIDAGDAFLVLHPLGTKPTGSAKDEAIAIKDQLEAFNTNDGLDGLLGPGVCGTTVTTPSDAIVVVRSDTFGASFGPPEVVATVDPFDQGTTEYSFRSNSYPTMAADENGLVYLAWTTRGFGLGSADPYPDTGDARIVISVSDDGAAWTAPQPIDRPEIPGHQIKPSLTYTGGNLLLTYYDFRKDISGVFERFIADWPRETPTPRHTVDVRAAIAEPGLYPEFTDYSVILDPPKPSTQASRYAHFIGGETLVDAESVQLTYNPPAQPMFKGGTVPFFSDYLDVAGSPPFVPDRFGGWEYNFQGDVDAVAHIFWTDDRDVVGPPDGDWTSYVPPTHANSGGTSIFDPNQTVPECDPQTFDVDRTRMRNQNIYTAKVTEGLYVAVPGNSRPLGYVPGTSGGELLQRAFVVFVQNATEEERSFELEIVEQPLPGEASFNQFSLHETADVTIEPYSSASRTVFVKSSVENPPWPSVVVDVTEIDFLGDTPLHSTVVINPDPYNPPPADGSLENGEIYNPSIWNPSIWNPSIWNPSIWNPSIWNPSIWNPSIWNPSIWNPSIWNPALVNPSIWNPSIWNPSIWNPSIWNPSIWNTGIANPSIWNPSIWNPSIWNTAVSEVTDVTWMVKNDGNATSAYSFNLLADQVPQDHAFQLMVYRVYTTPIADGCELSVEGQQETLVNITDPEFTAPDLLDPNTTDPDVPTFFLAPGEEVFITLRVHDPDQTDEIEFRPEEVEVAVVAQGVDTEVLLDGGDQQSYAKPDISVPLSNEMDDGRSQHTATPLPDGTILITGGFNSGTGVLDTAEIYDPEQRTFESTNGYMGVPRYFHTATPLEDGTVLIVGGAGGTPGTGAEVFDPVIGTFTPTSDPNVHRSGHRATLLADGRVLITGGNQGVTPVSSAEVYDPSTGTFNLVGSMFQARWEHSATLLTTGEVLIAGGYDGVADLATAELFDPSTDTFSNVPGAMTDPRRFHSATLLPDGTVLLAGGLFDATFVANLSADIYDRATDSLTPAGTLIRARAAHTATLLAEGKVLLAGGHNTIDGSLQLSSHIELYDWSTGSFIEKGHMTIARTEQTAVRLADGKVLFTGGTTYRAGVTESTDISELYIPAVPAKFRLIGSLETERIYHTVTPLAGGDVVVVGGLDSDGNGIETIERFSPATGVFTTVATMPTSRMFHSATLLDDGTVLIAGGSLDQGGSILATALIYDPGNDSVTPTAGDLGTARSGHGETLLQDGRVLIAAGTSSGGDLASTEIFDPVAGTFAPSDSLSTARSGGAAVLLDDGRVLIVGGRTDGPGSTAAFQLWDPSSETFGAEGLMNDSRRSYRYTLLNDGTVLIAGGRDGGGNWLDTAEIFDPATETFGYTAGTMQLRRRSHTQVLLPSGEVLLAGGIKEGWIPLSYAEIYDPITRTFRLTDVQNGARSGTRPTRLADGRVLIVGGLSFLGPMGQVPTSAVEVYNPWDIAVGGKAVFTSQPKDVPIGGIVSPAVGIAVFDNEFTPANAVQVELRLEDYFGGSPTTWVEWTNDNGIATFADVWFDRIGPGRRMVAEVLPPGPDLGTDPSIMFEVLPLIVTNTRDDGPGSLRRAIENAERNIGNPDDISFDIAGPSPHEIVLMTFLPDITDRVSIDGRTQPGFVGEPIVTLDGSPLPASTPLHVTPHGLHILGDNSLLTGLAVVDFPGAGIVVGGDSNTIIGNRVSGTGQRAIQTSFANDTLIGGPNPSDGNTVISNHSGVGVANSTNTRVEGNLISGSLVGTGIVIQASDNTEVYNNLIGTDAAGSDRLGDGNNRGMIITGDSTNVVVGGPTGRNIISGNRTDGIFITCSTPVPVDNILIENNYIGTDITGEKAIPNQGENVFSAAGIITQCNDAVIRGNLISGNFTLDPLYSSVGVRILGGSGNLVEDNLIGTEEDGSSELPNTGSGVQINYGGSNNRIQNNTIAHNGGAGVEVLDGTGNTIASNSMFGNDGLGIDLGGDGPTGNDPLDADSGANDLQNFPLITAVNGNEIVASLQSLPDTDFTIQFFSSPACFPPGTGEGRNLVGQATITTDGTGYRSFTTIVAPDLTGQWITATATSSAAAGSNTSEISPCYQEGP